MQTTSLTRTIGGSVGAALFALGLFALTPHTDAAQDQPQAQDIFPGRHGHGGPGSRGGRMGGPMGGGFGEVMRDLTDAQRQQVKGIRERHAEQIRPLMERVRAAREAVHAAVFSGNIGNLQALSIEVGNAETELTYQQAQVESEIFAVLTAEQKQKIAERRKQMDARRVEMLQRRKRGL
ncbi:MAG TPA: Spy/CpxP family protein refolding chaperone [Vicinamibacterales bacterium]|nr:Spy/CpxP family protein refolding chaperone [Vicinamibacterales bacterium]